MPNTDEPKPDPRLEAALAEWTEFKAGFRRSKAGNLWRAYDGRRIVIFKRDDDDQFGWMIANDNDATKRYSPGGFETEDETIDSVGSVFIF